MLASPYSLHTSRPVVLGIIGGGQLAKMTAQAAYRLGLGIAVIEHGADSPAGTMTKHEFTNGWTDPDELQRFIDISDIITLENEFVNPDILRTIAERRLVFPNADTVALVQDKLTQKKTFTAAGIPMTTFEELNSPEQAADFGKKHGFPYIIKTRTLGYDGYGNITVRSEQEAIAGYNTFTQSEEPAKSWRNNSSDSLPSLPLWWRATDEANMSYTLAWKPSKKIIYAVWSLRRHDAQPIFTQKHNKSPLPVWKLSKAWESLASKCSSPNPAMCSSMKSHHVRTIAGTILSKHAIARNLKMPSEQ